MRKRSVRAALVLLPAHASRAGAGGARAHSLINSGNVYDNASQCVYNFTAQAHSYNSVLVRSLTNTPPFHFPLSHSISSTRGSGVSSFAPAFCVPSPLDGCYNITCNPYSKYRFVL